MALRGNQDRSSWLAGWFTAILIFFAAPLLHAQHFTFAQFGQADGLLNQNVGAIVQDHEGVIWVGSENGVFRVDGNHFDAVEGYRDAEYGYVLAMHVDAADRIWIFGSKRLAYLNPQTFAVHAVGDYDIDMMHGDSAAIVSFPNMLHTVFLLQHEHIARLDESKWGHWQIRSFYSPAQIASNPGLGHIHSLLADPVRHRLWAGCGDSLCEITPSADKEPQLTVWGRAQRVPAGDWVALLLTRKGTLWARDGQSVIEISHTAGVQEAMPDPSAGHGGLPNWPRLAESPFGTIIANMQDGIARLENNTWQYLTDANGLPPTSAATMFFDRSGGFWMAPVGSGVWRWLGYGSWHSWTRSEGLLEDTTWSMFRGKDGLWVATTSGISILTFVDKYVYCIQQIHALETMGDAAWIAHDGLGRVWLAGISGALEVVNPQTHAIRAVHSDMGAIYHLIEEHEDGDPAKPVERLWLCTAKGMAYMDGADGWAAPHADNGAGTPGMVKAWSGEQDRRGNLWITTRDNLFRRMDGKWSRIELPAGVAQIDYPLFSVAPDGTLWVQGASPNPLLHLSVQGDKAVLLGEIGKDIIHTDDLSFIKTDARGWLWVGTDGGVYVNRAGRWIHYTQEDGLISDDMDTDGVFNDTDGSLWFGTSRGLSQLLHPEAMFETHLPKLGIRTVTLDGYPIHSGATSSFGLRQPDLSVKVFSDDYTRSRAIAFRYQLMGFADHWNYMAGGSLSLSDLPAGQYTLNLQAVDRRANTYSDVASFSFRILPPWYRRDRTRVAFVAVIVLVLLLLWHVSTRRLKANEALLKRKVDEQTAQLLAEKAELERAQDELMQASRRDSLTGLLNRSAIFEVLQTKRRYALLDHSPLAVIMADLDHFKSINDQFGHACGDQVLRECAERFRETLRPGDAIGRYGGEELLLVIPGLQRPQAAARMELIRSAIGTSPVTHGSLSVQVTCSFGVAWLDSEHDDIEAVLNAADVALYMAKQNGRNRVHFATEPDYHAHGIGRSQV